MQGKALRMQFLTIPTRILLDTVVRIVSLTRLDLLVPEFFLTIPTVRKVRASERKKEKQAGLSRATLDISFEFSNNFPLKLISHIV